MAKRLGEVLIDKGKITEAQLQKALKAQLIFGGHLGTSLIELGYIDEATLGQALAEAFNVRYATYDILMSAPYAVIRAIPAKLVEKFKVVPIRLDGKVLQLAMLDPKNLMALDEISFVTGYKIVPWVAPEIRIFQVLEKYYNIPRSQRYITLARELGKLRSPTDKITPGSVEPGTEEVAIDPSGPVQAAEPAGSVDTGDTSPVPKVMAAAPGAEARASIVSTPEKHLPDHWEKYGYGKSWREYADEMDLESGVRKAPKAPPIPTPAASEQPVLPTGTSADDHLKDASRLLQRCTTPEEVADVVLSFASRHLLRAALFIVKDQHAVGWAGAGPGFSTARVKGMNIPLGRDSLVSLVDDGRTHFLGRVPAFPSIRTMFQEMGAPMPRVALALAIRIKDRLASVLYGDCGPDDEMKSIDVDTFERLSQKASLALQMIILRNKIVSA